tara:strand:- start:19788 stop:20942 length:1155 start_codon:yes stop_codon:yes gene_type:complete
MKIILKKLRKIFSILLKTKFIFEKPQQTEILIFDNTNSDVIKDTLINKSFQVLYIRFEQLNIYCLFKALLMKKNIKRTLFQIYLINYIKLCRPKIIISVLDNDPFLYNLKDSFPNIRIILIQNGLRNFEDDIYDKSKVHAVIKKPKNNKYKVDYIFTINDYFSQKYKKFFNCETKSIGFFRNNNFFYKPQKIEKDTLCFISQYNNIYKEKYNQELPDEKILKFLNFYAFKKKKKLKILERYYGPSLDFCRKELKYNNWKIYFQKKNNNLTDYSSYTEAANSEVIVNVDSTLGYELLSRGKKVAFFSIRNWGAKFYKFGYPKATPDTGTFWTNNFDENKFENILNYLFSITDEHFLIENEKLINDIVLFDKKNIIFKEKIEKFLK